MLRLVFVISILSCCFQLLNAQPDLKKRVAAIDRYLLASGASGGLLIAEDGKTIWTRGYGWADEAGKVPISANTVFDIGSVTKQFTAAAILKLQEQHLLKVTDTITRFFPGVPEDKKFITIHQLLTHTAGFSHDIITEIISNRDSAIRIILADSLNARPGTKHSYSNGGYNLLAAIIEQVSGMDYESYLRKNLWLPASMEQTGNVIPVWKNTIASSYDVTGVIDRPIDNLWGTNGPSWGTKGSGAVLSTLNDLYTWHLALSSDKIISAGSKQQLFTAYEIFKGNGIYAKGGYGYGWAVLKTPRGTTLIEHNGGNGYHFTDFYRYIDEKLALIYFTNERQTLSLKLLDSISTYLFGSIPEKFPEPKISFNKGNLKKYEGLYQFPSGEQFNLFSMNGTLTVQSLHPGTTKYLTHFPAMEDSVRLKDIEVRIALAMKHIIGVDLEPVRDLLTIEGSLEEEIKYWKKTTDNWKARFGNFMHSEVVGSMNVKGDLVSYVLLNFEKGNVLVQCRQNNQGKFYVGTLAAIVPRFYRLIPQDEKTFIIYNQPLKNSVTIRFSFDKAKRVTGFMIGEKKIWVKKIS